MSYASEVLADSPSLFWRFQETSGTTAADSSGNGRDGTHVNTPTLNQTGMIASDSASRSVHYDGSSHETTRIDYAAWLGGNVSFTAECWIRPDSLFGDLVVMGRLDTTGSNQATWAVRTVGDDLGFRINTNGSTGWVDGCLEPDVLFADDEHHIVVTYNHTTTDRELFIDGVSVATATGSSTYAGTAAFAVAGWDDITAEQFLGEISEVALYVGTILSPTRILAHYNAATVTNIDVAGNLATETDTALAGLTSAPIPGGLATETDTPLSGASTDYDWLAMIRVGDHEWEITSTCSLDDEGPVYVLEGLRIGWQIDESHPWPTQPNPVQASLLLLTDDVVNLDDVSIGTSMSVVLATAAGAVLGTFHGRVSQLTAGPLKRGDTLYMQYQVAGVDFTVDLAETPIALPTTAAQSADDRFTTIVDAAEAAGTAPITPPAEVGTAAFEAITASTTNAGTLLGGHLDQVAVDLGDGLQRNIVVPVVDTTTDELERFDCLLLDRTVDASLLPGTFDLDAGTLVLTFPDMDADGVVDACTVQLDTVWTRLKYRAVNRVIVTAAAATAEASRPGPPVRLELTSTLTDLDALQAMADLYLPDVDENNGWVADPFTLRAYLDLAQIVPAWFPDHREDPAVTTVYVQPIAIVGIPSGINLAGDLVYAGQLSQAALVLNDGRITVTFALRRQLPLGVGDDAATWAWAQTEFPTTTWDDIDPGLSWYEARLGRAT